MKNILLLFLIVISIDAIADTWKFPKEVTSHEYDFGDVKVVTKRDGTKNQIMPVYTVEIYREGNLQALYKGISFDHVAADKQNAVFVGISNRGLPGTAIVIFDGFGNLKLLRNHNKKLFEYCSWSTTIDRTWYDYKNPDLKVIYNDAGIPTTIQVNSCKGKAIDILKNI